MGDLVRGPEPVGAQAAQVRAFFAAGASNAVAIGATLVAKQDRAGSFGVLSLGAKEGGGGSCGDENNGRCENNGKRLQAEGHKIIFS